MAGARSIHCTSYSISPFSVVGMCWQVACRRDPRALSVQPLGYGEQGKDSHQQGEDSKGERCACGLNPVANEKGPGKGHDCACYRGHNETVRGYRIVGVEKLDTVVSKTQCS